MFLDFVAHTRKAEEDAIKGAAHGNVAVEDGSGDAAAFELVEELARPAEEEEYENYIAQAVQSSISMLLYIKPLSGEVV